MTEATLAVTAGSGTLLRTDTKSISSNTVHREYFIQDDPSLASYIATAADVSSATADAHVMQLMAGASLNVRVRRIRVYQKAAASSVAAMNIQLVRLSTAGTGGTSVTPAKLDTADGASGATAMTLPSSKGTETTTVVNAVMWMGTAAIPTGSIFSWEELPRSKPLIIAAGTTNGLAIKVGGATSSTVAIDIEFTETNYV